MNGGISMPFFETIEKGITKAKDLGELSRLNGEIALRENHRKECFTALGEKYYDALKQGLTPDCSVLYQELEAVDQELERLRRDVQKLRKVMICPGCGAKLTCFGAFCPVCGAELVKRHVCPNCGAALDPGANFCVNCGNRMAEPDSRGE
jgi:hypothetical protein